jgi:hypothetical protein
MSISGMRMDEELRPRPTDAHWTWLKLAIVIAFLLAMAMLLLCDFERQHGLGETGAAIAR